MVRSTSPHAVSESYIVAQNGSICLFVFRSYCICLLLASVAFGVCGFCGFCRSWILCGFWLLRKEGSFRGFWILWPFVVWFVLLDCAILSILSCLISYLISYPSTDTLIYRPIDLILAYLILSYLTIYLSIYLSVFICFPTLPYFTLPDLT